MDLPDIYNGIIWTESAIRYLRTSPQFAKVASHLHDSSIVQIVLAPGAKTAQGILECFESACPPRVILALDTSPTHEGIEGFPRYCAQALETGVKKIHAIAAQKSSTSALGPLGALIASSEISLEEAQNSRPPDEGGVLWLAVEVPDFVFIGPELPSLAEQILIHHGADPERTLWLSCVPTQRAAHSVDFRVLLRRNTLEKIRPVHVGPEAVPAEIREWLVGTPLIELAGTDATTQLEQISKAIVVRPIRLHHNCDLLRSRRIFSHLGQYREIGRRNREQALSIVRCWHDQQLADPEKQWLPQVYDKLALEGFVFDNKSGAIAFDSYEWENDIKHRKDENWREIVHYFEKKLGGQWQTDRPNLARRLETPTKTILRGEEYYINMANLLPIDRVSRITSQLGELFTVCDLKNLFVGWDALWKWKLALAICDQMRNCVLQLNWFAYQMGRNPLTKSADATEALGPIILELTDAAVGLYYSTLLLNRNKAREHLATMVADHTKAIGLVERAVKMIQKIADENNGDMTFSHKFVRRWREADHPGENLLTAAQAAELCKLNGIGPPLAVGISWGGIELPLVFKHAWLITNSDSFCPVVLVANYSHYRKDEYYAPLRYIALIPGSPAEPVPGSQAIIFDDNSLTGLTIQRVHDDLLKRRCVVPAVFVTRVSGGRRYGQMRMKDHGVLNPHVVDKLVQGFLGETPFALSWSREEYENPIGVFSLARRRILELLHANSTVERYDREGF